jgi:hypothetical protein
VWQAEDMNLTPESPVIRRILAATEIDWETGCWLWTKTPSKSGKKNPASYPGTLQVNTRRTTAHRAMCEAYHGPIPAGYEVDHLCFVTLCVNPAHLEAVTGAENMRRRFERITHCPKDHEYTETNTRWDVRRTGRGKGGKTRHCRECERQRQKALRLA